MTKVTKVFVSNLLLCAFVGITFKELNHSVNDYMAFSHMLWLLATWCSIPFYCLYLIWSGKKKG